MTAAEIARERAAAVARHETEQHTNGQARKEALAAELQTQAGRWPTSASGPPLWRFTTTAPDGRVIDVQTVNADDLDWRIPDELAATKHLPGWTVAAEPVET